MSFDTAPQVEPHVVEALTYTTQIAPTILTALGLNPKKLKGVQQEHTQALAR